jgi:hypothetical protein
VTANSRNTAIGSLLVVAVPVFYLLLGTLVANGYAPYDSIRPLLNTFGAIGWLDLFVLGPAGIAVVVWSRGLRGVAAVVAILVSLPVFAAAWLVGVLTLSGALGNPG